MLLFPQCGFWGAGKNEGRVTEEQRVRGRERARNVKRWRKEEGTVNESE